MRNFQSAPGIVSKNNWTHFVLTINTITDTLKFYINGAQIGSDIVFTYDLNSTYSKGLFFGIQNHTPGNYMKFDGYIDETAIFDKALTSQQIFTIYNRQVNP